MAKATEFLTLELESKGITDITRKEAFRAWEHVSKYDIDHAVVTRRLAFEESAQTPCALLEEIATSTAHAWQASTNKTTGILDISVPPTNITELKPWVNTRIRNCVATVMKIVNVEEIDSRVLLSDYGVDSVVTIELRQKLQSSLKVKVPRL
jgi:6-methylsalicylic acid synthase